MYALNPDDIRDADFGGRSGEAVILVSISELVGLSNGLNEALSTIDEWEFHSRLALSRDEAIAAIADIRRILDDRPSVPQT